MKKLTVRDIISSVRSLMDEDSEFALNDERDIVPALNRGLDNAYSIIAKANPDALLTSRTFPAVPSFLIPEDVLEERVESLEIIANGVAHPLKRLNFREVAAQTYANFSTTVAVPSYYTIIGREIRTVPQSIATQSGYTMQLWALTDPPNLVKEYARISLVNEQGNYVSLEEVPQGLDSAADVLSGYVNIIDKNTGAIKGSLQVSQILGQRVTFRTTPTRNTVEDRPIAGALLGLKIEVDDYICPIQGSCVVPVLAKPVTNYITQYAVTELTRRLGGESDKESSAREDLEKQVKRTDKGRESSMRVHRDGASWRGVGRRPR
jgi:hypothetical protein